MVVSRTRKGRAALELRTGVVTALTVKGAGGERVGVYLDGRHAFDLSAAIATQADLRKDELLSEERQSALLRSDEPYRAREVALDVLARRELCSGEVATRLLRAGISEGVASATIGWLEERGYVDDRRFVVAYAADRVKAGWGRRRIVGELIRKGLERDMVAGEALNALLGQQGVVDAVEQVLPLVTRRFAGQLISEPEDARRRISGYLARRGHDWETIAAVLRALQPGEDAADAASLPES
jgi:regulatory protein